MVPAIKISVRANSNPEETLTEPDVNKNSPTTIKIFEVDGCKKCSPIKGSKRSVEHCLLTWFDIAYYSCVCPFRICKNHSGACGKIYLLHRNLVQKVACGTIHALEILIGVYELVENSSELSIYNKNPFDYLKFLLAFLHPVAHGTFSYHLWIKSKCYLNLMETLSAANVLVNVWLMRLTCSICFCLGAANSIYTLLTVKSCASFLVSPNALTCFLSGLLGTDNFVLHKLVEYLAYCIDFWRDYSIRLVEYSFDGLMLMICLTAYHVGVKFLKVIEKFPEEKTKVLQEYESIKIFCVCTNDASQLIVLMYIAVEMLYYAIHLKSAVGLLNMESLVNSYFFVNYLIVIYLAAEASKKMDKMKLWLAQTEVCESLPETKLSRLRYEVQINPLGLSGYGIFIMNYNFAASIAGFLMTYFIITVQFDN